MKQASMKAGAKEGTHRLRSSVNQVEPDLGIFTTITETGELWDQASEAPATTRPRRNAATKIITHSPSPEALQEPTARAAVATPSTRSTSTFLSPSFLSGPRDGGDEPSATI